MVIKYYDIAESTLKNKSYEAGSLYCCADSGKLYLDSVLEGKRVALGTDIVICASELPLAPIPNVLYCVLKTGIIAVYVDGAWYTFGGRPQLHFANVVVSNGTLTISDSRIIESDSAQFIPDLSVSDLASDIVATCANGSVSVSLTSNYDIPGELIVN